MSLFLASTIDDKGESFSVFISARDIVQKFFLKFMFNVLIFSYKVIKSIPDDGCEDFRHNRL